jgi:amino-acid N-acetyltransferase
MDSSIRTTVVVRPARPADLSAVESLLEAAKLPRAGLAEHFPNFLVAVTADGIVGVVGLELHPPFGLLRSLAVSDAQRGRGLGSLLVARAVARARLKELRAIYLLTTTADRWFPRHGFRPIARAALPVELEASEELGGACPDTAVCMEQTLEE